MYPALADRGVLVLEGGIPQPPAAFVRTNASPHLQPPAPAPPSPPAAGVHLTSRAYPLPLSQQVYTGATRVQLSGAFTGLSMSAYTAPQRMYSCAPSVQLCTRCTAVHQALRDGAQGHDPRRCQKQTGMTPTRGTREAGTVGGGPTGTVPRGLGCREGHRGGSGGPTGIMP